MLSLEVAGLPICVESADKDFFSQRFADYVRHDDRAPVMTMRTTLDEVIPPPEGQVLQTVKNVTILALPDGRKCHFGWNRDRTRVLFSMEYTPDYEQVDLHFLASFHHKYLTQTDREYMYTGSMFRNRLAILGGGVLHASAIAYEGQGIAFSAVSGTGKSTHTGLWKQVFGDKVTVVNDDKPAIRFIDGKPVLYGTPWSGKTALNTNMGVPLKAIAFVERSRTNALIPLADFDASMRIIEQVPRPYYDGDVSNLLLDFAGQLEASLPVYALQCDISPEAVKTAFEGIFPKRGVDK